MRVAAKAVVLAVLTGLLLGFGGTPAGAQNDPIGGFFRMIFGAPRRPQRIPVPAQPQPLPLDAGPSTAAPPKRRVEPKVVEAPKNADARVVLVLGDIEAQGLAAGLQMAFADDPDLTVVSKARATSGLARDGDGEWSTLAPKILADTKADLLVVMVGVNDWQPIPVPGAKSLEIGSDDWQRVYGERLDRFLARLKATGRPFWWVGLPPTADPDRRPTARAAYAAFLSSLNDLARPRVQAAGGTFVDIWNAFADEEGHYTPTGPDLEGQIKKLRSNDGVLFTRAGQRKLAFFVEQEIRRTARGAAPSLVTVPEEPTVQPKGEEAIVAGPPPLPPAPWSVVGPVIPLGDTAGPDGDGSLAGAPGRPLRADAMPGGFPVVATPAYRRLVEGLPIEPPAGRIDDVARRSP